MNILVLNSGGSSVKFKILDMPEGMLAASGGIERIGKEDAVFKYLRRGFEEKKTVMPVKNHEEAITLILKQLMDSCDGAIKKISDIKAVGHRVVHAGNKLTHSTVIDDRVTAIIEEYKDMAPLHNPPNLLGIKICMQLMEDVPQIAVFDSAFHSSIPDYAYIYGLPYRYYEKYGIRKYGFHGISFKYMTDTAARMIGRPLIEMRVVSLMLGSGCTANAMKYGKSMDVSTGFTPYEGLIQSTRGGDIDAAAVTYIMKKEGVSPERMEEILNKESGWLGISGISNDLREIVDTMDTNYRASLAFKAAAYRIKKYIGAYAAAMGGIDALIFSGGVGENGWVLRREVLNDMEFLGIKLDNSLNESLKGEGIISSTDSNVKVVVVKTDEELIIAREAYNIFINNAMCK